MKSIDITSLKWYNYSVSKTQERTLDHEEKDRNDSLTPIGGCDPDVLAFLL
jgi:hypothetical protein